MIIRCAHRMFQLLPPVEVQLTKFRTWTLSSKQSQGMCVFHVFRGMSTIGGPYGHTIQDLKFDDTSLGPCKPLIGKCLWLDLAQMLARGDWQERVWDCDADKPLSQFAEADMVDLCMALSQSVLPETINFPNIKPRPPGRMGMALVTLGSFGSEQRFLWCRRWQTKAGFLS